MALKTLYVKTRNQWRLWLEKHHQTAKEIWLIFYKNHTGIPCVTYDESVEEALCFGWIDSNNKRLDEERYLQRFSPRRPGSNWSESNRERIKKLTKEGRMTEAGMATLKKD